MVKAGFGDVERCRQMKDRLPVLDGDDASGAKRSAVSNNLDFVDDRDRWVTGPKEVRVERMNDAVLHGPGGCHQRLACNLAAKHSLAHVVRALTSKNALFHPFEVEEGD